MKAARIEDSYRLCPLQQGMLFNSLYAPDSGVDIVQVVCALQEDLQVAAFEQAWQAGVARHPILRTAVRWEGLAEPVQDVYRHVRLPLQQLDGRHPPRPARLAWLEDYLRADRLLGFTLTEAPLIRVALLRFAEADYRFVLTFHHIALDGRSLLLLLREVFGAYEALRLGQAPACAAPRPYRDYITGWSSKTFPGTRPSGDSFSRASQPRRRLPAMRRRGRRRGTPRRRSPCRRPPPRHYSASPNSTRGSSRLLQPGRRSLHAPGRATRVRAPPHAGLPGARGRRAGPA